ncbi:hypothetical protein [Pseudoclavibacter sp. CFCC 11306]|uniref:hypothetical protein n=1 Tax=Pseudoclavibacter sp. CFCC 11306 TaxID=1564493 RepID=UPI001300F8AD|nr:hypothetical protein [Pseudoclavibacter sp. CFCC 11306]KAB1658480.1 hypothetical protein F8O09_02375 [Pseudoclavibacter sp. CFCC 11306]
MSTNREKDPGRRARKEAGLDADLEQIWQDESPMTAQSTDFADQVDGELGTRRRAGSKHNDSAAVSES